MQRRAFTLIELLVVISIIGVLASIILASLSGGRDAGRVAADKIFSGTNYHALGESALGVYHLENLDDDSPSNNPLKLVGSPTFVTGVVNDAIQFNGGNYAYPVNSITLPSSWTISTWINPSTPGTNWQIFLSFDLPYIGISSVASRLFVAYWNGHDSAQEYLPVYWNDGPAIEAHKWYLVTVTYNGPTETMTLYFDGQPYSKITNAGDVQSCSILYIGAFNTAGCGGTAFNYDGLMDDTFVYPVALSAENIQRVYAQGLINRILVDRTSPGARI